MRDRTGLTTFALLALAGVEPEAIVDDYVRSVEELRPFFARLDFPDPSGWVEENLARRGFTLEDAVAEQLDGFDARAALSRAGLADGELDALVARLRGWRSPAARVGEPGRAGGGAGRAGPGRPGRRASGRIGWAGGR